MKKHLKFKKKYVIYNYIILYNCFKESLVENCKIYLERISVTLKAYLYINF